MNPEPSRLRLSPLVLFLPAIAVMNRLTFARKFILVGLLLSGPLAVILYLQFSSATERIEFNGRERMGVAYLTPVSRFLHQVQLHRLRAAAEPTGASDGHEACEQAAAAADAAVAQVDALDARFGAALGTTAEWRSIRQEWNDLRTRPATAAASPGHERITTRVLEHLLHRVGNYSNLILDPDLDSYWLMDAFVFKLPSLAETISRATATTMVAAVPDDAALDRTITLAADYWREDAAITDVVRVNLTTAFRETARFGRSATLRPTLEPPLLAAERSVKRHAAALRRELARQGPPVERRHLAATAEEALAGIYELEARIGPEIDRLVEARVRHYRAKRTQGLLAAAALAVVFSYLVIAIYLSVRRSVSALRDAPPADAAPPLSPPSRDELGQIAVAYTQARGEKSRLEEQLRLAERLATIGTLAAGTAHELNEPLGAILGFAQLAEKTPGLSEPLGRDLGKITRAALHARDVIRKLLLFARQTPPQKAPVDLRQVVQESLDLLQPRFDQAGIAVVRDFEAVAPVLADASQLRQVVLNLAVNALQASEPGGEVCVILRGDGGCAALVVTDAGRGMSEEVQRQVFVPFFTTKEVGQGTGLGLSVAHGIVTAHGGTIQVASALGRGATFRVELPLAEAEERK
jgi:signal transduction histidine kinase